MRDKEITIKEMNELYQKCKDNIILENPRRVAMMSNVQLTSFKELLNEICDCPDKFVVVSKTGDSYIKGTEETNGTIIDVVSENDLETLKTQVNEIKETPGETVILDVDF